ncbi:olfactory receptor 14J1-like [Strix uralensis]|uniref:olfactory receptor 14J1-like n=1 Tax=Strix uralensis TaxID=36305 RepID=UPI003DA7A4D2
MLEQSFHLMSSGSSWLRAFFEASAGYGVVGVFKKTAFAPRFGGFPAESSSWHPDLHDSNSPPCSATQCPFAKPGSCSPYCLGTVHHLLTAWYTSEFSLLTIMSYDRYVAICKPLHYGTLLGSRACVHMAAAAWGTGFLNSLLHTVNTFSLPLCQGNVLDQFFCEIPHILKLSCSHSYLREVGLIMVSACLAFGCFVFIVVSYVQILRAVLRIPSEQGRHKAFSTCLPHLAVISLFISMAMFAHLKPPSISSPSLNLVVSFLYSVVPPAVNPLIYSMRNQEVKDALRKRITRFWCKA